MTSENLIPVSEIKLENLMDTIEQLSEVLAKENDALKKYQIDEVSKLVKEKENLARLYQEMVRGFASNPAAVSSIPEEKRAKLKTAAITLELYMRNNQSLLKANIEANERMIQAVVKSASEHKQNESHAYSAKGNMGGKKKGYGQEAAFAFNQTL